MTWRDRAGFCRTSGRGTTPAVATKPPLPSPSSSTVCPHLAVSLLSVDVLVFHSHLLPYRHHLATMLPASFYLKTNLSPPSRSGISPPQYCGYWVDPAASCGGILPWARVRLGTGHWGGPVVKVCWPSEW